MNERSRNVIWIVLGFLWITVLIPLFNTLSQIVAALPRKGFPQNLYDTSLGFFFFPTQNLIITLSVFGGLVFITIIMGLVTLQQWYSSGGKVLRDYLRAVIHDNSGLSPTGIAQLSQALISVSVPLDEIFIHLRAVSDRPLYEIPLETQKLLEDLRRQHDLEPDKARRAVLLEHIYRLQQRTWASDLEQHSGRSGGQRNVEIEDVIQCGTTTCATRCHMDVAQPIKHV